MGIRHFDSLGSGSSAPATVATAVPGRAIPYRWQFPSQIGSSFMTNDNSNSSSSLRLWCEGSARPQGPHHFIKPCPGQLDMYEHDNTEKSFTLGSCVHMRLFSATELQMS